MDKHCRRISRTAPVAPAQVSNKQILLEGLTQIIDIALLAQRQSAFKTFFPPGGVDDTGDGGGVGGGGGGGGGGGFN